mmetsp:Transcript_13123/g.39713  ORF Transcript_13123/g.39713 Transcript_13123/m.39713 type:complete len:305 (-) Transcript_13123:1227-2141(-)
MHLGSQVQSPQVLARRLTRGGGVRGCSASVVTVTASVFTTAAAVAAHSAFTAARPALAIPAAITAAAAASAAATDATEGRPVRFAAASAFSLTASSATSTAVPRGLVASTALLTPLGSPPPGALPLGGPDTSAADALSVSAEALLSTAFDRGTAECASTTSAAPRSVADAAATATAVLGVLAGRRPRLRPVAPPLLPAGPGVVGGWGLSEESILTTGLTSTMASAWSPTVTSAWAEDSILTRAACAFPAAMAAATMASSSADEEAFCFLAFGSVDPLPYRRCAGRCSCWEASSAMKRVLCAHPA